MDKRLKQFIEIYQKKEDIELEVRFGTKKPITKIDFENVIKKIKSLNFQKGEENQYYLNITLDNPDTSNVRIKLQNLSTVQLYCQTNKLDINNAVFILKRPLFNKDQRIRPIDNYNFQFRINLKEEKTLDLDSPVVKKIINMFKNTKKFFRLMKRFSFIHPSFPVRIDCSIVKSSRKNEYTLCC